MEMTWLQQRGGRFRAAREVAEQLRSSLDCTEVRNALDAIPPVGGSSHQVDAVVRPYAEPLGFSGQKKDRPQAPKDLAAPRAGQVVGADRRPRGNRSPKVLSDTYTHVLMDERELDYEAADRRAPRRGAAPIALA